MAAAVSGGRATPGRRNTTMCENGLAPGALGGIAYRKDVGEGVSVGSVMTAWPAGTRPKGGWDIVFDNRTGPSPPSQFLFCPDASERGLCYASMLSGMPQ